MYVLVRARTPPAGVLCGGGGGGQATDQVPVTCCPKAAQSVVSVGLRAHTCETVSLSPRGVGGSCQKWSRHSALPPYPSPGGCHQRVGRECVRIEETKRRTAAMMLSQMGRDRDPPC